MKKRLLNEQSIRKMMKLANIGKLTEGALSEFYDIMDSYRDITG